MMYIRNHYQPSFHTLLCSVLALLVGCQQSGNKSPYASMDKSEGIPSSAAADLQLAIAQSHESSGRIDDAIGAYEKLANENGLPLAMHRLGVLYDQQGDFEKARENYQRALKHLPTNAGLLCDIGYSYYLQENWEASESHLQRALEFDPKLERAHNNLGLLCARLDRRDEALSAFRKATTDREVALANFNYVFADKKESASAPGQQESRAKKMELVGFRLSPLESNLIEQTQFDSPRPLTAISLPPVVNDKGAKTNLPPVYTGKPVSQVESSELVDVSPTSLKQKLVEPVRIDIPATPDPTSLPAVVKNQTANTDHSSSAVDTSEPKMESVELEDLSPTLLGSRFIETDADRFDPPASARADAADSDPTDLTINWSDIFEQ